MLASAETRLLRFLQASKTTWTPFKVILNTEELLPGEEKAMPGLVLKGLVLVHASETAYRISEAGISALERAKEKDD